MDMFQLLGLNDHNVSLRRQFVALGPEDRKVMLEFLPWVEAQSAEIAKDLYDYQMSFAPTREIFETIAARKGMDVNALRQHLEEAMRRELIEMFRAGTEDWGADYLRRLFRVGQIHNEIALPQKWYLGLYSRMFEAIGDRIAAKYPKGPQAWKLQKALFKVMNLGMQAVGDSYFMTYVASSGFDLTAVTPKSQNADATDCLDDIKSMFARVIEQFKAIAANRLDSEELAQRVPGQLGDAVQTTVANARTLRSGIKDNAEALYTVSQAASEMREAVEEISRSTASAVTGMQEAEGLTREATGRMDALSERSKEIGNVVKLITSIADQTNLLALNATIEAARSGEAGRGFAVVAGEVKELARQAAAATEQIRTRIQGMQSETTEAVSAIDQIGGAIGSVAEASQSIASAVEEQSAVNDKLATDMARAVERNQQLLDE